MEEPLAAPVTTAEQIQQLQQLELLQLQRISRTEKEITAAEEWLRIRRLEKEIPAAEVPATAPVTVPAPATVPRTPDGTWRVRESGPQGGGPRRGYSPMDRYFGGFHGDRRVREIRAPFRRGSWNGRKTPPLLD